MKEDDGDWKDIATAKAYDKEYKVPDLKPDKKYDFAVVAENKIGRGDAMETTAPTVLKAKPKKPGKICVFLKYRKIMNRHIERIKSSIFLVQGKNINCIFD